LEALIWARVYNIGRLIVAHELLPRKTKADGWAAVFP